MNRHSTFYIYIMMVTLILLLQSSSQIYACATPVFRYAIEKWPADSYYAIAIHDGPLSEEGENTINQLNAGIENKNNPLNLKMDVINIAGPQITNYDDIIPKVGKDNLPAILLFYPHKKDALFEPFWHGPLNMKSANLILDSPARKQVVKQLIAGNVAAWVVIKSGNKAKDSQTIKNLTDNLHLLQKEMQEKDKLDAIPFLKGNAAFSFSIIPISDDNKDETIFRAMILNMEPHKKYDKNMPAAFPIFGQGRALSGHQGETLKKNAIGDICIFLCGECSCMVKAQNPGIDMMMAADWEKALENIPEEEPKDPPVLSGINPSRTAEEKNKPSQKEPENKKNMSFAQIIILTFAGLGCVTFAISGYIYFKK